MRRLERTIAEIGWTRDIPRVADVERVAWAYGMMSRGGYDCVLVMTGRRLGGIFTSRDFLHRVAAPRRDPARLALAEVMTPAPRTLRPHDGVVFAINWMALEGYRNVPVVDDGGLPLGVLTVWDVMRHLGALFDDLDAIPRAPMPGSDTSKVVAMIDLGGDA